MGNILIIAGVILFGITSLLLINFRKKPLVYEAPDTTMIAQGKTEPIRNGYVTNEIQDKKSTNEIKPEHIRKTEPMFAESQEESVSNSSKQKPVNLTEPLPKVYETELLVPETEVLRDD